jgi:hypothetical protein
MKSTNLQHQSASNNALGQSGTSEDLKPSSASCSGRSRRLGFCPCPDRSRVTISWPGAGIPASAASQCRARRSNWAPASRRSCRIRTAAAARTRDQSRHDLVFGGCKNPTMMQLCASAAKLRNGGPILHDSYEAHGGSAAFGATIATLQRDGHHGRRPPTSTAGPRRGQSRPKAPRLHSSLLPSRGREGRGSVKWKIVLVQRS